VKPAADKPNSFRTKLDAQFTGDSGLKGYLYGNKSLKLPQAMFGIERFLV